MNIFWSTDLLDLAGAKSAVKTILKPGRKAKFVPQVPGCGSSKEIVHRDISHDEMKKLEVPASCGGIWINLESMFLPSSLPTHLCVLGSKWHLIRDKPKSRWYVFVCWYLSRSLDAVVYVYMRSEYGIGFGASPVDTGGKFSIGYGAKAHEVFQKHTGYQGQFDSQKITPTAFREKVNEWIRDFGLENHPSVTKRVFDPYQSTDWPMDVFTFDHSTPRWVEENGEALLSRILEVDAHPDYHVRILSNVDYAATDCTFLKSENIREELVPILQAAKDHALPGIYRVYFYTILSPSWKEREKRKKKLKGETTEAEKLGELLLENGTRAEVVLVIAREGYRLTLFFEENPDDATRFPDTTLCQKLAWKLQN